MVKEINVTNLSDSIRFYSLLLGRRPSLISYDYAIYHYKDLEIRLFEDTDRGGDSSMVSVLVTDQEQFKKTFKNLKNVLSGRHANHCQVLDRRFTVPDPDGVTWVITTTELANIDLKEELGSDNCYLEPINF